MGRRHGKGKKGEETGWEKARKVRRKGTSQKEHEPTAWYSVLIFADTYVMVFLRGDARDIGDLGGQRIFHVRDRLFQGLKLSQACFSIMVLSWVRDIDTIPIIQDLPHEKEKLCICYPFPAFTRISSSFAIKPDGKREKDSSSEMQLGCPQVRKFNLSGARCAVRSQPESRSFLRTPPLRLVENSGANFRG